MGRRVYFWGGMLPSTALVLLLVTSIPAGAVGSHPGSAPLVTGTPGGVALATAHGSHTGAVLLRQGLPPELVSGSIQGLPGLSLLRSHGGAPQLPTSALAHPSTPSTASNWVVANSSTPDSIVQVGGSSQTLLLASPSLGDLNNGSLSLPGLILTPSVYLFKYGFSTVYRSTNGGESWGTTWVPTEAAWRGSGTFLAGTIGVGIEQIASGPTGGASGATVFGVETFEQACQADFETAIGGYANCTSTAAAAGPMGLAVTESTNGGQSWGLPTTVASSDPSPVKVVPAIGTCAGGNYYFPGNYTRDPQLQFSPAANLLLASWMNISMTLSNFTCQPAGLSANFVETSTLWTSHSSNLGVTWSAPTLVSTPLLLNPFFPTINSFLAYFSGAVGPGPTYPDYQVWLDWNHSSNVSVPFAFSSSTNNATSWSAATDIGSIGVIPVNSANPGEFLNSSAPSLAADNWTGSTHKGNLYLVWADNRTSGIPGTPSIAFSTSSNGGSTWSSPVYISAGDTSATFYFQPTISVGPTGQIWVEYYGESTSTIVSGSATLGSYNAFGVESSDGGSTWSTQFPIADAPSQFIINKYVTTELSSISGFDPVGALGGGPAIVDTTSGAYATWTDCRTGLNCPTSVLPAPSAYVTNLDMLNVTANIAGVNPTLGYLGTSSTLSLPATAIWEKDASVTLTFPQWLPDTPTTIYAYQNVSGFASSVSNPAQVTYPGAGNLLASYLPEPAGWIAGHVGPISGSLQVVINGASVALSAYNATAEQFNTTIAAGQSYSLTASATAYTTYSTTVPTQAGKTSSLDIVLPRVTGWIAGKVTPANASLLIDGAAALVNQPSGAFNITEPWGTHWVNATENGYTSFSQMVTVAPSQTLPVNPTLSGGWIQGSVNPITGKVWVNGVAILLSSGNFNVSEPGGVYNVTATAHGYSTFQWHYAVTPGVTTTSNIRLTNQGWINGSISPAAAIPSAIVLIGGLTVHLNANGVFNASEGAGAHTIQVTATGYNESTTSVTVSPGNVTAAPITLNAASKGGCTVNCKPPPGGGTNSTGSSNLLLYVGIGVVVLVVAALAAILLMRRRPPRGESSEPASEPAVYDESTPGTGGTEPPPN
ncbi:MAG: glycoside hydrolase [Thermoplasmata archaeon]|nr:glycoside hydrolase [Thermoplasmata archaeon]